MADPDTSGTDLARFAFAILDNAGAYRNEATEFVGAVRRQCAAALAFLFLWDEPVGSAYPVGLAADGDETTWRARLRPIVVALLRAGPGDDECDVELELAPGAVVTAVHCWRLMGGSGAIGVFGLGGADAGLALAALPAVLAAARGVALAIRRGQDIANLRAGERQLSDTRLRLELALRQGHERQSTIERMAADLEDANRRLADSSANLEVQVEQRTRQLVLSNRSLQVAIDEARASGEAKTRFLARVTHELRTPLTGVLGALELLRGKAVDADQQAYLDIASQSGAHLLAVIHDILDFSQLADGAVALEVAVVDVDALVADVVLLLAPVARGKGLELRAQVEPAARGRILADAERLRQVLLNLVGNALKFTARGAVLIQVAGSGDQRVRLRFAVLDSGPGVPVAQRGRVFEAFTQLDDANSRSHEGTGLGLAICRNLVGLMGGEIGVDDNPAGPGSEFWFTLNAERVRDPAAVADRSAGAPAGLSTCRVLLVDDNAVNRRVLAHMFRGRVADVRTAEDGNQAVLQAGQWRPDIILMDIQMPGMDGLEATRCIRADAAIARTPIVALTANVTAEDRNRALDAGMDGFLTKPVHWPALASELTRVLGVRDQA